MIYAENNLFILETDRTAYAFDVMGGGTVRHLYYGNRLPRREDYIALAPVARNQLGNSPEDSLHVSRENLMQEAGGIGWGDLRSPMVELSLPDGGAACDFLFSHFERPERAAPEGLPCAEGGETLKLVLRERAHDLFLELYYTVFADTDVIGRWARLINDTQETIWVNRMLSQRLDLPVGDYDLMTFRGAWAREMKPTRQPVAGELRWSSRAGVSSNRCNPFAMICRRDTNEDSGDVWGFNLLYSGNHLGIAGRNSYGRVRITQGMGELRWQLKPGETLDTPQGIMAFSSAGFNGVSRCMHPFVQKHIVRGYWRDRERPVLVNSWEALYFKVSHRRVAQLAKNAREIGAELLVLDDGWFRNRGDDTRALGDWVPDRKKLPGGLAPLVKEVNDQGLDFGIWVEPEMVSEDSDLYRTHPDWILGHKDQAIGRHQYALDLGRSEVCDYIVGSMTALLNSANIRYVKWDMNRILTDTFSPALPASRQGEATHRYMLGLYGILQKLTEAFPEVLFESCASGGNRFDLGMLCYTPQIWASDNTDAACRSDIQWGYSYGYPQSVLGCHVSDAPNHQTLRVTPLHSRFYVAAMGVLGYELDPGEMDAEQRRQVRGQIEFYKAHRRLFQFGRFYRCCAPTGERLTMVVSPDGTEAAGVHFALLNQPNPGQAPLYARGLEAEQVYDLTSLLVPTSIKDFGSLVNMMSPVRIRSGSLVETVADRFVKLPPDQLKLTASGAAFCRGGFYPVQSFGGTGLADGTRVMKDFDSRLYLWKKTEAI
ncbi:MAG: alpha-galactosidase [Oscillospiraceae bacterium]|nr:alpha-galactosidase [Oscillospiraceae bacterium]